MWVKSKFQNSYLTKFMTMKTKNYIFCSPPLHICFWEVHKKLFGVKKTFLSLQKFLLCLEIDIKESLTL